MAYVILARANATVAIALGSSQDPAFEVAQHEQADCHTERDLITLKHILLTGEPSVNFHDEDLSNLVAPSAAYVLRSHQILEPNVSESSGEVEIAEADGFGVSSESMQPCGATSLVPHYAKLLKILQRVDKAGRKKQLFLPCCTPHVRLDSCNAAGQGRGICLNVRAGSRLFRRPVVLKGEYGAIVLLQSCKQIAEKTLL
ncbi:hypothetical protein cyc_02572 [Cyclospora cayetanensis]|uniref:Uncharacterized protein n=1 Tax=Cyclospora cayetanensis TaxID=88456 RepID=A0A1D3CYU2_9EIME|nr:hypothetical protein cyc_02572 [Cyclospora cayetanensis]